MASVAPKLYKTASTTLPWKKTRQSVAIVHRAACVLLVLLGSSFTVDRVGRPFNHLFLERQGVGDSWMLDLAALGGVFLGFFALLAVVLCNLVQHIYYIDRSLSVIGIENCVVLYD